MNATAGGTTSPVSRANKARNEAVKELIQENSERYAVILAGKRAEAGLPADPGIAKRRQQIEKAANKLKELGVTVNLDEMLAALDN